MTTGASISTKERPSLPANEWGGPLRYQDVVSLSSHTKNRPPGGSHCDHRRAQCRYTATRSSPSTSLNTAQHYDEKSLAALLLSIATTNLFNRLNLPTRQVAGA